MCFVRVVRRYAICKIFDFVGSVDVDFVVFVVWKFDYDIVVVSIVVVECVVVVVCGWWCVCVFGVVCVDFFVAEKCRFGFNFLMYNI